jgi:mannose-6-phosphate isomerase-like protein (cupin superfamily)
MKVKYIKSKDVEVKDFKVIEVQNLFAEESYKKLSVAKVKIKGTQKFGKDLESDSAFYVLEGKGTFYVGDEKFLVEKGDLIFIPKNTLYKDEGKLTLLVISVPKFDRNKRIREK